MVESQAFGLSDMLSISEVPNDNFFYAFGNLTVEETSVEEESLGPKKKRHDISLLSSSSFWWLPAWHS